MSKVEQEIEAAAELLDRASTPAKMSIREAVEFWEGIIAEAQGRLDALSEDLKQQEVESDS